MDDLNEIFNLGETEEAAEETGAEVSTETEEAAGNGQESRKELDAETRHRNAARRRAEEERESRRRTDEEIKKLGIKNIYRGNKLVESLEDMRQYNADNALNEAEKSIREDGLTDDVRKRIIDSDPDVQRDRELIAQARRDMAKAQIDEQFKKIQELDPSLDSIDELFEGERGQEFRENAELTHDIYKAYKLTFMDEIMRGEAARKIADAGNGKGHLKASASKGNIDSLVSQDTIDAYKMFDPNITVEEIIKYEKKYKK